MPAQTAHTKPHQYSPPAPLERGVSEGWRGRTRQLRGRLRGPIVASQPATPSPLIPYLPPGEQAELTQSSQAPLWCRPPCRTSSAVFTPHKTRFMRPEAAPPSPRLPQGSRPGRSALTKMAAAPQRSPSQKWRQLPGRGCTRAVAQSGALRMRGCRPDGNHGQEGRGAERGAGGEGERAGEEEEEEENKNKYKNNNKKGGGGAGRAWHGRGGC